MKRNIAYIIFIVAASLFVSSPAEAGTLDSLQLKARVGYSIGGTMPIPLPETIRSIDSYSLTPSFMVGFDATLPLTQQWGIMTGIFPSDFKTVEQTLYPVYGTIGVFYRLK